MIRARWSPALLILAVVASCRDASAPRESEIGIPEAAQSRWDGDVLTIDHQVPHVSTVPANAGQTVHLFVRERVRRDARGDADVVLFVHGGSVSSVPAFDLRFGHYSWLARLAKAGFDVFAMDVTGYGRSPRPAMDDPCNVDPANQDLLIPRTISVPCGASYPFRLSTIQAEWDELDRVVDYIRDLRGVDRISLIGWSLGGNRVGPYAAEHGDKLKYLMLYAPTFNPAQPGSQPAVLPQSGFPMTLQDRADLFGIRWGSQVQCVDQIEAGVRDAIWGTLMDHDDIGSTWGPPEGVMRVATRTLWGWNSTTASRVNVPTLVVVGQHDGLLGAGRNVYRDLGTHRKVFVEVACGTHFMVWERQHRVLHHASLNWLKDGNLDGVEHGEFFADTKGMFHKQ